MGAITVTVAQWVALVDNLSYDPTATYVLSDTAKKITGLPPNEIFNLLTKIELTDAPLVLDAAQAKAALNVAPDGQPNTPYDELSPPSGDQVTIVDTFADITGLGALYIEQLKLAGVNAVRIAATAASIEALTQSQINDAASLGGVTIDTSVVLSTSEAVDFTKTSTGAIKIVAPTNQAVVVAGTAAKRCDALSIRIFANVV